MSITPDVRRRYYMLLSTLVVAACARPGHGQTVQWRSDYNAARKEATEKGRPILLDFGTDNCMWCKKLELSTFRDPAVVKLLNEAFIALKIDANSEPALAQTLRISQYPTLV